MPDSISSLATRNFDNANLIRQEDVGELMNKEGRFTLDDAGKLTVINPPTRRDGKVTRFFKGLFSSSYRAEQRMLDRMEVLERNVSFNAELRKTIGNYRPTNMERLDGFSWNRTFNRILTRIQPSGEQPVTPAQLKQAASEATHFSDAMRAPSTAFSAIDGSVEPVLTDHGPMSLDEFITANRTDTTALPEFQDVARAVGTNILQGRDVFPLLSSDECARFNSLIAKNTLTPRESNELQGLRTKAEQNLINAMSSFASKALEHGADPTKLANHLGSVLVFIGRGNSGTGNIISNQFSSPEEFAEAHNSGRPYSPSLPDTPHTEAALRAMDGDKAKAAQLILYCEAKNISPEKMETALRMSKHVGRILMTANDRDNLLSCDSDLKELSREMWRQMTKKADFGADDYMTLFGTAAFASWLHDDRAPINFNELRTLVTACADIDDELNPQFELNNVRHPLASLLHSAEGALTVVQRMTDGWQNVSLDTQPNVALQQNLKDLSYRTELSMKVDSFLHGDRVSALLADNGLKQYGELSPEARTFLENHLKLAQLQAGRNGLDDDALENMFITLLPAAIDPTEAQRQTVSAFVNHMATSPVNSELVLRDLIQISRNLHAFGRMDGINSEAVKNHIQEALGTLPGELVATAYNNILADPAARSLIALTDGLNFTSAVDDVLERMPDSIMTAHEGVEILSLFGQSWGPLIDAFDDALGMSETAEGERSQAQSMREAAAMTDFENIPVEVHEAVRNIMNEMGLNGNAHPFLLQN